LTIGSVDKTLMNSACLLMAPTVVGGA